MSKMTNWLSQIMNHPKIKPLMQFIKFGLVGVSNTLISQGIYYLCVLAFGWHYQIGNILGFVISVTNAYIWNSRFIFSDGQKKTFKEHITAYAKSFTSYGFTFILSTVLLFVWVECLHISDLIAPLINLVITIPMNFLLNKFWAFKRKENATTAAEQTLRQKLKPIDIVLLCVVGIELALIVFVNLTMLRNHLGFDASSCYLFVKELWNQKTLFPNDWSYQTGLGMDSSVVMAWLVYGAIGDVFTAYGLCNILTTGIIVAAVAGLTREMKWQLSSRLLTIALIITPYFTTFDTNNALNYFAMVYGFMASYSYRVILLLAFALVVTRLARKAKMREILPWAAICLVLSFLTGLSTGLFMLIMTVAPFALYIVIRAFVKNDIKSVFCRETWFIAITGIMIVVGKVIAARFFHVESRDTSIAWIAKTEVVSNAKGLLFGYFDITSMFPSTTDISIISLKGIAYCVFFAVGLFILVASIIATKKHLKAEDVDTPLFSMIILILSNIAILLFSYTTYGSEVFETRYVIFIFMGMLLLVGQYIEDLPKDRLFSKTIILCVILGIICSNGISYYSLCRNHTNVEELEILADIVDQYDTPMVYVVGDENLVLARNLRVIDETRTYRTVNDGFAGAPLWGDTLRYYNASDYQGEVVMITTEDAYATIPTYIAEPFELVGTCGQYLIYRAPYIAYYGFLLSEGDDGQWLLDLLKTGEPVSMDDVYGGYVSHS